MMKTPTGAVVLIEALRVVGLARVARNRCGIEQCQRWHDLVARRGSSGHLFIGDLSSTHSQLRL
jgi:hypothetical protein